MPTSRSLAAWIVGTSALVLTSTSRGETAPDTRVAAELLPTTTVIYAEMPAVPQVLDAILEHPLRAKLEALDEVQAAYEKKEFLDFKAGVAIVESQVGLPWQKILKQTMGGGVAVAVDAETQGGVLLFKATDDQVLTKLLDTLVNLARLDATSKDKPDPIKTVEYRGLKAYGIAKAKVAVAGPWLVVTNQDELAKGIADRYLDRPADSLATQESFQAARKQQPSSAGGSQTTPVAWGWVHTAALREAGVAKQLYSGKSENPLAELLVGGILSTLQHTPYVAASLRAESQQLTLGITAPHQRDWAGESREYFFGPDGNSAAPPPLDVPDTLLSLRAYRDISGMWLRAGDLFDENTNEELAKADSNLSTLFGGKDFGEDILGSFQPEMHFLVARQEFAADAPQPAIKLPAFSFVFRLKDVEKMQPELRRTFQSLIGFLNVVGAMNGQPQLELDMEKSEGVQLVSATYLANDKSKDPAGLRIHYNFSPSVAFAGERIVIASTKVFAKQLASAPEVTADSKPVAGASAAADAAVNTAVQIDFDPIRAALADNRGQLVAQNMLEEGHTKEEAEREINTLLELVGWLQQAGVQLSSTAEELRLELSVTLQK